MPSSQTKVTQEQRAQADRVDTSMENLCWKLLEFLAFVLQEASSGHTTEQPQSSGHATEQAQSQSDNTIEEEYQEIAFDKISEWADRDERSYDHSALSLHKQMWDIMLRTKQGLTKENMFCEWCRRIHMHTEAANTASANTATEHAEANFFKSLAVDMLSNDLTTEQRHEAKYKIRTDRKTGEIAITTKQRSWINNLLRKNLGDSRVAYFIANHGLPLVLDLSIRRKAPSKAMLHNMLEELMSWHAALLQSILEHHKHPDMATARKLASLDQNMWRMQRRERKLEAKQRMVQGSHLRQERDSGKRKFDDMHATQQQILEDFDTGKSAKRHHGECAKKLPFFRGKML